jgi:hypothetical protein
MRADASGSHEAVQLWARSTWKADADLHGKARDWVTAVLSEFRGHRGAHA